MKILILTTSFPLTIHSMSGIFILRLIEHLPSGIDVTVLTPDHISPLPPMVTPKYKIRCFRYAPRKWQRLAHEPGGLPVALKEHPIFLLLMPIFLLSMFVACIRHARNVDLIHANWSINGVVAGIAGLLTNTPVMTTLRGTDINRVLTRVFERYILNMCLRMSEKIITVSNSIQSVIKKHLPQSAKKIVVIPNGVGMEFLEVGIKRSLKVKTELRFTVIGNLIPLKGVDTVIQAFGKLPKRENVSLAIIGDGPEKQALETLSFQLSVAGGVQFFGSISHEEIPMHLMETDILILSSFSEGRPNVVIEAMAAGVPVIATNIESVKELIQDETTGLLFKPGDVKQLTKQIKRIISNPELRHKLGKAGRDFIIQSGFTWDKSASCYAEVYREIHKKN